MAAERDLVLPLVRRGSRGIEVAIAIDQQVTARVREEAVPHAVAVGEMQGQAGSVLISLIATRAVQDAEVEKEDATSGQLDRQGLGFIDMMRINVMVAAGVALVCGRAGVAAGNNVHGAVGARSRVHRDPHADASGGIGLVPIGIVLMPLGPGPMATGLEENLIKHVEHRTSDQRWNCTGHHTPTAFRANPFVIVDRGQTS